MSTGAWIRLEAIEPPSGIDGPRRVPNDSCTNVSPTSVLVRSVARVSRGSGANSALIWIRVRAFPPLRSILMTLPTETPLIRTSE
jgi:hypothetical protein